MQNIKGKRAPACVAVVSRGDFVPELSNVISPAIVADVFKDQSVPFTLNHDGSVDRSVYQEWLNNIGKEALEAFAECSEVVSPKLRKTVVLASISSALI